MGERTPQDGDLAPGFALLASDGRQVDLNDYRGKNDVVLYFYPKDDTPGCTREACDFRDAVSEFSALGAVILGVSGDASASHQRFSQKYALPFTLLSDPDFAVCKAYGVYKLKQMYGKTFWGIERTTFLIDRTGQITQVFLRVKVEAHIDAVLSALKTAQSTRQGTA
jgi:peroxiredoxin Q/BCP